MNERRNCVGESELERPYELGRRFPRLACKRTSVLSAAHYGVRYFGVQVVGRNGCSDELARDMRSQRCHGQ